MGVHGLWKLIEPVGKPVPLESLENKVLAVDVSIWLYQLTKGLQTTGGGAVPNAHILGLFNRICKLLYYRIKPIFVFDGGVPALKKETIELRKKQKRKANDSYEQIREKMLNNLLKQKAVGELLGKEAIASTSRQEESDMFALPPLPEETEDAIESSDEDSDTEMSSAKVESLCNYMYGKDVHSIDITSEQFKSLPPEIRHEVLSELIETRKQSSWGRFHEMKSDTNFSDYQMKRLMKRRNVQRSLDNAAKEMGGRMMTLGELEDMFREDGIVTDSLPGRRIAKDNVTQFIYVSGDKKKVEEKSNSVDMNEDLASPVKSVSEKEEMNEDEFRNQSYQIDQNVFMKDSSSDDEDDYARQLSREENMSQEEILRIIKARQSVTPEKSAYFQSASVSSASTLLPTSSTVDLETDSPDEVEDSQPTLPQKFEMISSKKSIETNLETDSFDVIEDSQTVLCQSSFEIEDSPSNRSKADSPEIIRDSQEQWTVSSPKSDRTSEEQSSQRSDVPEKEKQWTMSPPKSSQTLKEQPGQQNKAPKEGTMSPRSIRSSEELSSQQSNPSERDSPKQRMMLKSNRTLEEQSSQQNEALKIDSQEQWTISRNSRSSEEQRSQPSNATESLSNDTRVETEYVGLLSESDSDSDFIEVTENSGVSKLEPMEIIINPSQCTDEDDIFADIFLQPNVGEPDVGTTIRTTEQRASPNLQPDEVGTAKKTTEPQVNPETEKEVKPDTPKKDTQSKNIASIFEKAKRTPEKRDITPRKPDGLPKTQQSPRILTSQENEELLSAQRILYEEELELQSQYGKQERLGSTITQQMIIEAQELLRLFGLPFVIAPMEAEAQCAFLDQASLTEGTITDDSDIWLFGGQNVYKNFFDNHKYVLQFRNLDIEHFFKLSRKQLIQLALLVGSDYTVGIEGVGPVTAIEILAYFSDKTNKPETEAEIADTLRKFKRWISENRNNYSSALSRKVKNVRLSEGFPSEHVIEAYLYPNVDESNERFTWAAPDLDRIRRYMKTKFAWKESRIDDILLPVMKRLNNRQKQTTLDAFFKAKPYTAIDTCKVSERVIRAINIMKNNVDVDVSALPAKSPRKKNNSKASPGKKSTPKKRERQPSKSLLKAFTPTKPGSSMGAPEKIPQRERSRLEAAKRKTEAAELLRKTRKYQAKKKKRGVLQPKADSSYLSESSSGEG